MHAPMTSTTPSTPTDQSGKPATLAETVLLALAAAGADENTLDTTREIIATGQVYRTFAVAVHDQHNRDLLPIVDMLDEVIGRVANHQSLKPLVALIEKEKAAEGEALPGHYAWCEAARCVLSRYDDGDEQYEHTGPTVEAVLSDPSNDRIRLIADLGADENLVDEKPMVFMRTAGADDGLMLDTPALDQAIANLEHFVDGLHTLRRLMVQEKRVK